MVDHEALPPREVGQLAPRPADLVGVRLAVVPVAQVAPLVRPHFDLPQGVEDQQSEDVDLGLPDPDPRHPLARAPAHAGPAAPALGVAGAVVEAALMEKLGTI